MNAYELADDLEKLYWLEGDGSVCPFQAQATMLRQQADRIKELETKYQQEFDYAEKLLKEQEK